jgi:hypothetical protein
MAPTPEIQARIDAMKGEFEGAIAHYQRLARANYKFALFLMGLTLLSSAGAAVGGIFLGLSAGITGGLALLPGAFCSRRCDRQPPG